MATAESVRRSTYEPDCFEESCGAYNGVVRVGDGRILEVHRRGYLKPDAQTVMVFHGFPGSRIGPHLRTSMLWHKRIQLVAYSRPGYCGSTRVPGRRVCDSGEDASAVADALGIEKFGVLGRSGGVAHALASAALLSDRVKGVVALVGSAPRNAEGLDWFEGMTSDNRGSYSTENEAALREKYESIRRALIEDRCALIEMLQSDEHKPMPESDQAILSTTIGLHLANAHVDSVESGIDGWVDDILASSDPNGWGFSPSNVTAPTLVHGEINDPWTPVSHSRWLAGNIRGTERLEIGGASHFQALYEVAHAISWLCATSASG